MFDITASEEHFFILLHCWFISSSLMTTRRLLVSFRWSIFLFSQCFFCIFCIGDSSGPSEEIINFFGKAHSANEWRAIQTQYDSLMKNGVWIRNYHDDVSYYHKVCIKEGPHFAQFYIGPRNYGACFNAFANTGERFIWQPKEEIMYNWSPSHMCELMNGRNMLIVGDSISEQFFFSILSSMMARVVGKNQDHDAATTLKRRIDLQRNTCFYLCDWNKPCVGPFAIDCGDNHPPFHIGFALDIHMDGHPFLSRIMSENISLLVINVGAHYQDNATILAKIRHSLSAAYAANPLLSIVWRNTYAGHKHCTTHFRIPPSTMLTTETLDTLNFSKKLVYSASYKWEEFDGQNELIRDTLSKDFPAVFYLDVAAVMRYRHDSHPKSTHHATHDCLHYCLPGPLDTWAGFLYNVLAKVSLSSPSQKTKSDDDSSVLAMTSDKYTRRDGLILKAKHYDMYFMIERGVRHHVTDPSFIKFLDQMPSYGNENTIPKNSSEPVIRIIDEDEEMYEIPAANPV